MRLLLSGCSLIVLVLLGGCARYPSDGSTPDIPPITLRSTITVAGGINPAYYYFLAIDTDNDDGDGPVPVVSGPEQGTGWGTISGLGPNDPVAVPPFFVVYNGGSFQQYRDNQPIGRPYRAELSADRRSLTVEIDARELVPAGTTLPARLQLNWITMKDLTIPPQDIGRPKEYDGFGPTGTDYLYAVPLNQNWSRASGDLYGTPQEQRNDTTATADIDLIGWSAEIRLR